jgi:hypothetical protein
MKPKSEPVQMKQPTIKEVQSKISLFLIIFFVLFGAASLYLLLNSPA